MYFIGLLLTIRTSASTFHDFVAAKTFAMADEEVAVLVVDNGMGQDDQALDYYTQSKVTYESCGAPKLCATDRGGGLVV